MILIFPLSGLISGCGQSPQETEFSKSDVRKEVVAMLNSYHNDIERDGLMAEFRYLDSSEDFFWVPPGYNTALGYDTIKTIILSGAPGMAKAELQWDQLRVNPLTPGLATYSGVVSGSYTDTAGNVFPHWIIESGTVIKREDGWKLLSGQTASR